VILDRDPLYTGAFRRRCGTVASPRWSCLRGVQAWCRSSPSAWTESCCSLSFWAVTWIADQKCRPTRRWS